MDRRLIAVLLQCGQFVGHGTDGGADVRLAVMRGDEEAQARGTGGTAGGRIGWTLMPRSNKARDRRKALTELPTMTGTTGVPAAEPVSRPRSLVSFRNNVANSRSRATRCGSR